MAGEMSLSGLSYPLQLVLKVETVVMFRVTLLAQNAGYERAITQNVSGQARPGEMASWLELSPALPASYRLSGSTRRITGRLWVAPKGNEFHPAHVILASCCHVR